MSEYEFVTDKYVFFWNGIYSQWLPSSFIIDGITFNCCEQYMMYKKAKLFGDDEIAEQVLATKHPSDQKELGKKVKNFNKDKWDEYCFSIVYQGNYAKFTQNEELKKELLNTGDRIIVEASPYDKIWGIKMGMGDDYIELDDDIEWDGIDIPADVQIRNR